MKTQRFGGASLLPVLLLWLAVFAWESPLSRAARASAWFGERQTNGSPAFVQIAGSFRMVGANALWLKVDAYHHEWEERGLDWTKNADLLPLLRAITFLDPHFAEAYGVHGFLLATNDQPRAALVLLAEGIRNNPKTPDLQEAAGMVYATRLGRPAEALPYFARARALTRDSFDQRRLARTIRTLRERIRTGESTLRR